jgi:hypothetical protein
MELATELLGRVENDVLIAYLRECRRFWEPDGGRLDRWEAQLAAGELPDFAKQGVP